MTRPDALSAEQGGTGRELALAIARSIGVTIVLSALTPGTFLATELKLAAQRGVARSVVCEALRILSAKGLIVSRRRAGTRVRERQHWNLLAPDVLAWMFDG